jgi:DNA helicase II / ATP-dependent DNA helicase PcrA
MSGGPSYLEGLNAEQRAAVEAPDGPVLVIAAAGTGKTRTLTHRVAALVHRGVPPSGLLLLTFTNRASREMLDRAKALAGPTVSGIWGGTFHHLCNRLLRRHAPKIGLDRDYTILDSDDASKLMKVCLAQLPFAKDKAHPKPDIVLHLHSLARNALKPLPDVVHNHFHGEDVHQEPIGLQCRAYEERKIAQRALDFDDLLVQGVRLLEDCPDLRERYQMQFEHILVDEYQDTNPLQARLVDLLAAGRRNLLVVGDDFQSIYAWRGADFRHFLTFPQRYPGTREFRLETNYRSVPGVLEVANACIRGNPHQFQKTLRAVRPAGAAPVWADLRDGQQQAAYVIEQIHLLRRAGIPANEIAVLYRAHFHAMELELQLARENQPYHITSGVRFFEQAHIKDALSLLRLLQNPSDELAFRRLAGLLPRVGERTADRIHRQLGGRVPLHTAEQRAAVASALPAGAREAWTAIGRAFEPDRGDAGSAGPAPASVIQMFVEAFYREYAENSFDEFDSRLEDLEALADYASRYTTAADLLSEVALLTNMDGADGPDAAMSENQVQLSTVHQAKGLEWKAVLVLWCVDQMFPSSRAMMIEGGEEEERRLFYVAVTRACDRLFLCAPRYRRMRDGGVMGYAPSRFLREIPQHLLDHVTPSVW